jgi:hypothetical protein
VIDTDFSVAEMDAIAEELKREGLLCWYKRLFRKIK